MSQEPVGIRSSVSGGALADSSHDHVEFALSTLQLFRLDDPKRASLAVQIAKIQDRLADPRYQIAVIGEFSSGKTTFINALLEADLFPTAVLATTAAAVAIRHGKRFTVTVCFHDGEVLVLRQRRWWQVGRRRAIRGIRPARNLQATLAKLITDDVVAPAIARIDVEYPAAVLADGLTIVDTPGTNAQLGHSAIACEAVSAADAAVVVLSALEVLPLTLVGFLLETLDPLLLQRCAFVVTRMDNVRPAERDELVRFAATRVRQELSVPQPSVVGIAPQVALMPVRKEALRPGDAEWIGRFAETRRWLRRLAMQQRDLAVADTVLRQIDAAMRDLGRDLEAVSARLAEQRAEVQSSTLADLPAFLEAQRAAGLKTLREMRTALVNRAEQSGSQSRASAVATVSAHIEGCQHRQALQVALGSTAAVLVQNALNQLGDQIAQLVRTELGRALTAAVGRVGADFAAEYAKIQEFSGGPAPAAVAPVNLNVALVDASNFTTAVAVLSDNTARGVAGAAGGAMAGAAAGTMMLPGIGTVIGTVIGGLIGAFTASKNFATLRAEARDKVAAATNEAFGQAQQQLSGAVGASLRSYEGEFARQLDWYRVTYQGRIDEVRAVQQRELLQLTAYAQQVAGARQAAADRRTAVERQRSALADDWMRGEHSV